MIIKTFLRRVKHRLLGNIIAILEINNKRSKSIEKKLEESIALNHLMTLQPVSYIPVSSFSIFPSVLNRILNDIVINKRENIIEFGAGTSTIFIALLIKRNNLNATFISVESNSEWINSLEHILRKNDCFENVRFIYSPIKDNIDGNENKNMRWYDKDVLSSLLENKEKYDLIVVDGPQGDLCTKSRFPAIPFLKNSLADNFAVFLDDLDRKDELEIAREWSEILRAPINRFSNAAIFLRGSGFSTKAFYDSIN